MKRFYAAESSHGSASSHGFANDWVVFVFDSKEKRDEFVRTRQNITTKAIRRDEVTKIAANWSLTQNRNIEPRPFTGEFWGLTEPLDDDAPYIGTVEVCDDDNPLLIDRFYK